MNNTGFFARLGSLVIEHPKKVLLGVLLLFSALISQMQYLRIDTSAESFLRPDSEALLDYERYRKEFGRDEFFIVVITGVDVFSLDFLATFKDIHESLSANVDNLQSVESLVNVRSIYGEEDDLVAEDLLESFPANQEELDVIKQRIRGKDIYYGRLINQEEDTVALFVKLIPYTIQKNADGSDTFINFGDAEIAHGSKQIKEVLAHFDSKLGGGKYYVGGTQEMGAYMSSVIQSDFGSLTAAAVLIVALILAVLFKRASGVFLPMVVMALTILSTIAMLPVLNYPIQITTSIIPSFLLAVCIGDSVHILSIFYKYYDQGLSKKDALIQAFHHTGESVLFTSLTTAAGLLCFVTSDILPIASLGLFAAFGAMLALVLTLLVIPVLIILLPIKAKPYKDGDHLKQGGIPYKFTRLSIYLSTRHPVKVVIVGVLIAALSLIFIPNIRFSQDSLSWFPEDNSVKQAVKIIESKITGSMPIEIIIDTHTPQGALNPELLQSLDKWLGSVRGKELNGIEIRSINSLVDLVKESNQAFNGNNPDSYAVPNDQELIAQELLLVEMDQADDLYLYTNKEFSKLHITMITPWQDAILFQGFLKELQSSYDKAMSDQWKMHVTGVIPIFSALFAAMVQSAIESYILAAFIIAVMMMILLRNVLDGLIAMLPNFIPIMIVLAFMAIKDWPMDVFTVLIGSIAVGLCVDDTIHFMHGFKQAYKQYGDAAKAIEETLMSTGKALMITSIVLFWGFLTFTLSDLSSMDNFGILTAMCIALAIVFDFLMGPALMMLRYGNKKS